MIRKIEALNYRCLRYVSLELGPFHVLVGPNASGKTTFLDVVSFLGDLLRGTAESAVVRRAPALRHLCWNRAGTQFELAIELQIPTYLQGTLPNGETSCRYEVAVAEDESTAKIVIAGEALFLQAHSQAAGRPTQRDLFPDEPHAPRAIVQAARAKTPKGWRKVVHKSAQSGNDLFRSETGNWTSMFRLGPQKAALANLPEDESRFPVAVWVKRTLMETVQGLTLNSFEMRMPTPRWRGTLFRPDGSNLPAVIETLRETDPGRFSQWLAHIQTALPDVVDVVIQGRPEDSTVYLELVYNTGLRVPSWLVSDGTLRMMALTLLAYVPGPGPVYLVEEPENGIHPRAVEAVFQSLSSVYQAQVLVATHSPVLLGLASPEQVLCFAKTPAGATDIVRGADHPALREWSREVDLRELYAAGVLG